MHDVEPSTRHVEMPNVRLEPGDTPPMSALDMKHERMHGPPEAPPMPPPRTALFVRALTKNATSADGRPLAGWRGQDRGWPRTGARPRGGRPGTASSRVAGHRQPSTAAAADVMNAQACAPHPP